MSKTQKTAEQKLKIKMYKKQYRKTHKQEILEYQREWIKLNVDKIKEKAQEWREKNRDKINEYHREWHKNHPKANKQAIAKHFSKLKEMKNEKENYQKTVNGKNQEDGKKRTKKD